MKQLYPKPTPVQESSSQTSGEDLLDNFCKFCRTQPHKKALKSSKDCVTYSELGKEVVKLAMKLKDTLPREDNETFK